ncbi:hypothetical protein [Micromonospora sp. DPT]|uniref:hypothetical protein n=1 Tax=Micromonospora sp. DPT TaxID=3142975 RepID=UPI0032083C0B
MSAAGAGVICSAVAGIGPGVEFFGAAFFGGVAFLGAAVFFGAAVFLGSAARLSPEAVVRLRVRVAARLCSGTVVWLSFSAAVELSPGVLVSLSPGALGSSSMVGRLSPWVLVSLSPGVPVRLSPEVAVGEVVSLRGVAFLAVRLVGDAGVSGWAASVSAAEIGGVAELTGGVGVALELTGPVGSAAPGVIGATVPTGRPGCSTGVPSPPPR